MDDSDSFFFLSSPLSSPSFKGSRGGAGVEPAVGGNREDIEEVERDRYKPSTFFRLG